MTPTQMKAIMSLLASSPAAVGRAMVILLSYQTVDEIARGATVESNGVGFSAATDINGTYFAKWVLNLHPRVGSQHLTRAIREFLAKDEPGRALTGKFLVRAREIAILHRKQLAELLAEEAPDTRRYTAEEEWDAHYSAEEWGPCASY